MDERVVYSGGVHCFRYPTRGIEFHVRLFLNEHFNEFMRKSRTRRASSQRVRELARFKPIEEIMSRVYKAGTFRQLSHRDIIIIAKNIFKH